MAPALRPAAALITSLCLSGAFASEAEAGTRWGDYVVGGGMVTSSPAAGLAGDLGGRAGPLRGSLELGLWYRGSDGGPRATGLGVTSSVELGFELWIGHRATLGPAGALDLAWLGTMENRCGVGTGCRYSRAIEMGATTAAWDPAVGIAWNTNARAPLDKGFELSLMVAPTWRYDQVLPVPRTEVAWRPGRSWIIAAELSSFEATARVGRRL